MKEHNLQHELHSNLRNSKARLSKDRAYLFLSIVIAIFLLSGFPQELKLFALGTAGTITGGAVAVQPAELKDYFVGLVIFAGLMIFLWYLVYALRNPRPESWYPQISDEGEFAAGIGKDMSLENDIERINQQLKDLRKIKETQETAPAKKAKKITKVPDVREMGLERALRNINAQLQGYAKAPVFLEAPPGKGEWDGQLEQLKKELSQVDKMKFEKVKVRAESPSMKEIALQQESKKLQRELKEILSKDKKNPAQVTVLEEPPQKRQWNENLEKVDKQLENIDQMPIKNVKIREEIPMVARASQTQEQKQLAKELQQLNKTKEEEETAPIYFFRRLIPSSRERQLAKIKKQIQKKGPALNKEELAEIERRLAEIHQSQAQNSRR